MSKTFIDSVFQQLKAAFYSFYPIQISVNTIFIVSIIGVFLYIILMKFNKKARLSIVYSLLFGYIGIILAFTIFDRPILESRDIKLQLFWSYKTAIRKRSLAFVLGNVLNMVLFIPFGGILSATHKKSNITGIVCITMISSLIIEMLQYCTWRGLFEFDDILHNTIGAAIGFCLMRFIVRIRKEEDNAGI